MTRLGGWILAFGLSVAVTAVAAPHAPDYSSPGAWAAWPGHEDTAADAPAGVASHSHDDVDVFFIHPTTDLRPVIDNAAFDAAGRADTALRNGVLRFQASVFNDCCRIYAPQYRQATLKAITTNSGQAYATADLAYRDVEAAFTQFLAQTGDRPFILAAHSQGSIHALRLLQQKIIGAPLQKRMVVAYIPGVALPLDIEKRGLPVCRSPAQTGCVVSWNTVAMNRDDRRRRDDAVIWWNGRYQAISGRPLVCVNPLTWTLGGASDGGRNPGSVHGDGPNAPIPAPVQAIDAASCETGLLGVTIKPENRRQFADVLSLMGIYHDFDYSLFYMAIRQNAALRVAAFQKAH
jgi:hypothetical protein